MNRMVMFGLVAIGGAAAAAAAASAQDGTPVPGQPTQARVWVQNTGDSEAIPVSIERTSQPLRVELATMPTVSMAPGVPMATHAVPQPWEYRAIRLGAGGIEAALNAAGADGWEATGVAVTDSNGPVVIMKRPR
jgi:hypothetical protein